MITILIEPADNGAIKIVQDDNVNAAGETFESRFVYDFDSELSQKNKIKFFKDLALDLGIDLGNSMDSNQIQIKSDWGSNYTPSQKELEEKINALETELKSLRSLKK